MRTLFCFLFLLIPASAQITDLATDATGSTLLVRTQFRLQSEPDVTGQDKIYRWQNGVWTRLGLARTSSASSERLFNLFIGAGGQIYGWHVAPLITGPSFFARPSATADIYGIALPAGFPSERMSVSANGRYVAGVSLITITGPVQKGEIFDSQTGSRTPPISAEVLLVASDGTYASSLAGQVNWKSPSSEARNFAADELLALSDDARWLTVLRSGNATVIATADGSATEVGAAALTSLSNTRLLYVPADRPTELREFDPLSRQSTLLASLDRPLSDIAISADGSVAWLVTDQNRLFRIAFPARGLEEVLPPLGHSILNNPSSSVRGTRVPGSATLIPGNFTRDQQVFVDNEPFPQSDVNADGYWFQVPWEWQGRSQAPLHELTVRTESNPFEMVTGLANDGPYRPSFPERREPGLSGRTTVIAAHEDYGSLVTQANPARPGEMIHVYMTGLGRLAREVPTGAPGPGDGVPIASPFQCTGAIEGSPDRTPLTSAAAFYAPTMIGIYVAELVLPANIPDGHWALRCGDAEKIAFGWVFTKP